MKITKKNIFFSVLIFSSTVFSQVIGSLSEKILGDKTIETLWSSGTVIEDIEAQKYINRIGQEISALSSNPEKNYLFYFLNNKSVNAFASWNGVMAYNSGLFFFTENESELAAVVAHEVSHVSQDHLSRFLDKKNNQTIYLIGGILSSILVNDPDASSAILASTIANDIQNQINFTREHEWEADHFASEILLKSKYNPIGLGTFFQRLINRDENKEFLRTHPLNIKRVSDNLARFSKSHKESIDSTSYDLIKAKIFIDLNKNLIEEENEIIKTYSKAYKFFIEKNYEESSYELNKLLALSNSAHVNILAGRIHSKLKNIQKSLEFFERAYEDGLREESIYYKSIALKENGKLLEGISALRTFIKLNDSSVLSYELLSELYNLKNDSDKSQFYKAESLIKQRRFDEALVFFNQILVSTNNKNLYQVVESRLKNLEDQISLYKKVN